MCYEIRRVKQGDAEALGAVQTASWKAAFRGILSEEMLEKLTDPQKAAAMYRRLLADGTGNGYIGEINGKAHCIAYWDKARDASEGGTAASTASSVTVTIRLSVRTRTSRSKLCRCVRQEHSADVSKTMNAICIVRLMAARFRWLPVRSSAGRPL